MPSTKTNSYSLALEFKNGASMAELAAKYDLPRLVVEEAIREELFKHKEP